MEHAIPPQQQPMLPPLPRVGSYLCGDRFRVLGILGQGGFGCVVQAIDRSNPSDVVALKVSRLRHRTREGEIDKSVLRECGALLRLSACPGVARLREVVLTEDAAFLVMNAEHGTLRRYVSDFRGLLAPAAVLGIAGELLRAICAVHDAALVHRDIKPDNVLCDRYGCNLRLADFGMARVRRDRDMSPGVTTFAYRAPEVPVCDGWPRTDLLSPDVRVTLCYDPPYGEKIDVWGAGCVIAEVYTKRELTISTYVEALRQAGAQTALLHSVDLAMAEEGVPADRLLALEHHRHRLRRQIDGMSPSYDELSDIVRTQVGAHLTKRWPPNMGIVHFLTALLDTDPNRRPSARQALELLQGV
jgi:serine/threonine protein kinase